MPRLLPGPPALQSPLLRFNQVVLTPHVGSLTYEGMERMGLAVVGDVLAVLRGERPRYPVNAELLAE